MLAESVSDRLLEAAQVERALAARGQTALLAQIAGWAPDARACIVGELAHVDLDEVFDAFDSFEAARGGKPDLRVIPEPAPVRAVCGSERKELGDRGLDALASGRVAALMVAGGQGTRLGFDGPKGALPIGPVSGQTLFGHHAGQIRAASACAGAGIPWLIMTSPATHAATRALFRQNACFGLPLSDVFFLCQRELPCLDLEGNLMVASAGRFARSPDGHGGVFECLAQDDVSDSLEDRGIRLLSYFQVDNPLLPVLDPVAIGSHLDAGVEWTVKVTPKERPDEKLGNCVGGDGPGRLRIVEYTELGEPERSQRLANGELRIGAGTIGAHVIDLGFVRRVAESGRALPLHLSQKSIPTASDPAPRSPNGHKLERFMFDALERARRAQALQVDRADEYAPIKNQTGEHSPETAQAALSARSRRWLDEAGIEVRPGPIEIDLAEWSGRSAREQHKGILVGEGVES